MITTAFPFAPGEPYIEAELPYLAKSFDRVFLFTLGIDPGKSPTQPNCSDAVVCNPSRSSSAKAKLFDTVKGVPYIFRFPDKYKSESALAGRSPLKRLFAGRVISRINRHSKEIFDCLSGFDFSVFDETVIYGYWFFVAAGTGVLLKEKLSDLGARNIAVFSRAHSYDIYEYANKLNYLPLRRFLLENTDGIFTCSESGREHLLKNYPEYDEKISTQYLGTQGGCFKDTVPDKVLRILTCSRTIPLKRLDRLVCALSMLHESGVSFSWTHIGDGPSLGSVKALATEKLSASDVCFTGSMIHDDVLHYIKENDFDIFVNVSEREGLPVSVMEALSFGIPSVVTDVGGCREIITDGENGLLIPADFSDELLCDAILQMATMTAQEKQTMRRNAFSSWQKKFNAETNYTSFINKLHFQ